MSIEPNPNCPRCHGHGTYGGDLSRGGETYAVEYECTECQDWLYPGETEGVSA